MSPAELLEIDQHLDAVLRAAGSALRHYTMQKSLDDMREAMRAAMAAAVAKDCDAAAVIAWANTPGRKPANLAFTAGAERQAAYWIEWGQQGAEETCSVLIDGAPHNVSMTVAAELVRLNIEILQQRQDCKHVGTVETAVPGCKGFHVRLHPDSAMPEVGATLYAAPPKREPLSDEEILHRVDTYIGGVNPSYPLDNSDWINFARAIELLHGLGDQS